MSYLTNAELLETAEEAAGAAGTFLRERWSRPRQIRRKGFRDLVTDSDLEAQKRITAVIRRRYPTHAFLTEEADAALPSDGPVTWIIDPIDGTSNFSRQLPVICVSVAAAIEGASVAAVIFDPLRREMFSAAEGKDSALNGRPIRVSSVGDLSNAIAGLDWSRSQTGRTDTLALLNRFAHHVQTVRALGSAALALAWIAAGRLDLYINLGMHPWDLAAGDLLVRRAGGHCSTVTGDPLSLEAGSMPFVAANAHLHAAFLALLEP